jgi:hypothetical protein
VTVNTDKNIFYSAYLRGKIQYNDVDPDELIRQNTPSPKKMEINKNEIENKLVEMNIHIHKINIDETNEKEMDKIVIHIENENNNNEEIV